MPKVTEAHLEARKQQIIDAAFVCFARQGFHQTTMQDICREAELSPGAVYRYFGSKAEIIEACCGQCEQSSLAIIDAANQGDAREVLDQLADAAFCDFDLPEADTILRLNIQWWSEALRSPELKESLRRASIEPWKSALAGIVERAQRDDRVDRSLDPEAVARVFLAMWQGLVLQKTLEPQIDVASYLEAVKALAGGLFSTGGTGAIHVGASR